MTEALTTFFNILAGTGGTGVSFFYGFLSYYITGVIVILLIDPIIEWYDDRTRHIYEQFDNLSSGGFW